MTDAQFIEVTPENVKETGLFCLRNPGNPGFEAKVIWHANQLKKGLKLKLAINAAGEQLGFIEYTPSEYAWRPVNAKNYLFINCLMVYPKRHKEKGYGTALINECIKDAKALNKAGVGVMTSDKSWIADKRLFLNNGFEEIAKKGRFELLIRKIIKNAQLPAFFDWQKEQLKYKGWHLVYADQCPFHEKAALDLSKAGKEFGVELNIVKLTEPEQAQHAPSGFGVFSLLHDGRLLEDHYISATRFKNILRKELAVGTNDH